MNIRSTLHSIGPLRNAVRDTRDALHHVSLPWFRPHRVTRGAWSSWKVAELLRRDGICILPSYFAAAEIAPFRGLAQALLDAEPLDEAASAIHQLQLRKHPAFATLLLDELILAAVEGFYRKPVHVVTGFPIRYEPAPPLDLADLKGTSAWHHDSKGHVFFAMWLLTDVPPDGQHLSYVIGSHRTRHRWESYEETRLSEAQALALGHGVVKGVGPAGTVILFDTNGAHRPNRCLGPRRDAFFSKYSAGRYRDGLDYDLSALTLTPWQREILERSRLPSRGPR